MKRTPLLRKTPLSNMTPAEVAAWERLAQSGLLRRALALDYRDYKRALQRAVVIVQEGAKKC